MRSLAEIEAVIENGAFEGPAIVMARDLLLLGEEVLEHWLLAKGLDPTQDRLEQSRLLALHRQGARLDPSFNASRETCRELAFHYNMIIFDPNHMETAKRLKMMQMLVAHICYFVSGKMQSAQLGEFCCSSRSLRQNETV